MICFVLFFFVVVLFVVVFFLFVQVEMVVFVGGCFWCVELDFEKLFGVCDVVLGYVGGDMQNLIYKNYECGGYWEVV